MNETKRIMASLEFARDYAMSQGYDMENFLCDYSVNPDMLMCQLKAPKLPCLHQTSEFFSFSRRRALVGEEFVRTLGFTPESIASPVQEALGRLSEEEVKDLATNGMAVGHVGLLLLAIVAHLPDVFERPMGGRDAD